MMKRELVYISIIGALSLVLCLVYAGYVDFTPGTSASLTLTIVYEDGSTRTFTKSSLLYPATIWDSGTNLKVARIDLGLSITPVFTGTVAKWSVEKGIPIAANVYQGSTIVNNQLKAWDLNIVNSTQPLVSGQALSVWNGTISAAEIEAGYSWVQSTVYTMKFHAFFITMTLVFGDGTSYSRLTSADIIAWDFKWAPTNQFISLSVSWFKVTVPE